MNMSHYEAAGGVMVDDRVTSHLDFGVNRLWRTLNTMRLFPAKSPIGQNHMVRFLLKHALRGE